MFQEKSITHFLQLRELIMHLVGHHLLKMKTYIWSRCWCLLSRFYDFLLSWAIDIIMRPMADVKCKQTKFQNVNKDKINAYFNTMYLYQIINGKTVEARTFRISMLSKPWGSGSFSCSHVVQLTYNFPLLMLTVLTQLHISYRLWMGHDTADGHISAQQGPRRSCSSYCPWREVFVNLCLEKAVEKR